MATAATAEVPDRVTVLANILINGHEGLLRILTSSYVRYMVDHLDGSSSDAATRPDDNEMEEAIPDTAISEDDLQLQVKEQAASNLSFADLCARMEKVTREVRQRDLKLDVLFPKKLRLALKGSSPYPLFRLLLPQIDTARGAYYIKQAGLARLYLQVLALDLKNSADAQKLLRYRQPPPPRTLHGPKKRAVTYDWPEVLEEVLIGRVPKDPSKLNLGRINELLDRLARAEDNTQRIAVLSDVTRLLSPNENKWLARIILQDMKIGMREEQILGFYHSQAMDLWAVTCDLRYVCSELSENARQIDRQSTNIQLFRPFTPMLAAMIHHQLHKVEPAMRLHPFAIEMKIDGERMLCHKKGSDVRWWTRSATNYTKMYGPLLSDSIIKNVGLENCILDGEVIGWDVEHECFLPFKENRSIAVEELRSPGSSAENPRKLVYVIFDIVFLQGPNAQDLLDKHASMVTSEERRQGSVTHLPLRARRDILQEIVAQEKKKLELMRHQRVESEVPEERSETLMKAFDAALEHREEGLVVKDLTSPYILGEKGRSLMLWIKMKPEYSDQTKNLDVIVLGAYYSEGKRRHGGQLGSLLIGVAESLEEIALKQEAIKKEEEGISNGDSFPIIPWADEERPPRIPRSAVKSAEEKARETQWFYTLGRVGNGLSFQEWEDLEKCLTLKKWPAAGRALAKHFKPWKIQKRDVPDFCIEPQKSVIVEVKCAEIVKSDAFSSGLTLRFPRIEAVRDDKPWYQCITIRELKDLYDDPTRRSAREMRLSQETTSLGVGSSKRRRKATQESGEFPGLIRRAPVQVVATYKTVDPSSIETKKDVLHGLEICVLGDLELGTLSDSDSGGGGSSESDTGSILSFTSGSSRGDHRYLSKGELEKLIVEAGGTLTSTPRAGRTALVIAPDDRSLRVKMLIKSGNFEIVGIPYILRCLQKGIVADPTFYDFIYMTEATKKKMVRQIDAYGDSYTEPITEVGFKKLARKIQERSKRSWREEGLGTKEVQAILMKSSSNLFWVKCRVCIYFDRYEDVGHLHSASGKLPFSAHRSSAQLPVSRLDFFSCLVRLLGGCVAEALTSEVTHVVVDPQDRQRFKQIAKRLRELRRLPIAQVEKRVVGLEWIEACLEANGIVIVSSQHEIRLPSR